MVKTTPVCIYLPWAIYIFFLYFTTDLGTVAFELPQPIWQVYVISYHSMEMKNNSANNGDLGYYGAVVFAMIFYRS